MRIFCIAICSFFFWACSASAVESGEEYSCGIHFRYDKDLPVSSRDKMRSMGHDVAEICTDAAGKIVDYFKVSEVFPKYFDVCTYAKIYYKESSAPTNDIALYMAVAEKECPNQKDAAYLFTQGVSQGLFSLLFKFSEKFRGSQRDFDESLSISDSDTEQKNISFGPMQRDLLGESKEKYYLERIVVNDPVNIVRVHGYKLIFKSDSTTKGWIVYVDFTPQGLKIVNFDQSWH